MRETADRFGAVDKRGSKLARQCRYFESARDEELRIVSRLRWIAFCVPAIFEPTDGSPIDQDSRIVSRLRCLRSVCIE
jgi:hypothetical protein